MNARRLRIHGNVQGVGYRQSMQQAALRLQITGWVRNRRDGTVEALVMGVERQVAQIIEWARSGPRFATVDHVDISLTEAVDSHSFEILFSK